MRNISRYNITLISLIIIAKVYNDQRIHTFAKYDTRVCPFLIHKVPGLKNLKRK